MTPEKPDVVTSYGPCHKCGRNIEEPDKPVKYLENAYHQKCLPTKEEEEAKNKSHT